MAIPNTTVKSSHAVAIKKDGKVIGMIQKWSYSLNRDVTAIYELNPITSGEPVDNVPGNVKGLNVDVERVDLFGNEMEKAFGYAGLELLSDQTNPFDIVESWSNPDGTTEQYTYTGCWFTKINRSYEAGNDRVIRASGALQYLKRVKG